MLGDEEMRNYIKRQQAKRLAAGATQEELDEMLKFPEPIAPTSPLSPDSKLCPLCLPYAWSCPCLSYSEVKSNPAPFGIREKGDSGIYISIFYWCQEQKEDGDTGSLYE